MLEDRLERLEMDMEEERQSRNCVFCAENPRDLILFPCSHFIYCHDCFSMETMKLCPRCNMPINSVLRVNLDY